MIDWLTGERSAMPNLTLTVNGRSWSGEVRSGTSLLDLLRQQLHLTGAKLGCGEGQCGSCTVLVDRLPVAACTTQAATVAGARVTTIEGLAPESRLHPVQQAFVQAQAFQCGFCTPGMVTAAVALLERTPSPSEDEIRRTLNGHLCRCGAYPRIIEAVRAASAAMRQERRRG
jgi:aerobic-type carbon monoxide dehydrogenase small subunit (CoxS/CutS family)